MIDEFVASPMTFGRRGRAVTPDDDNDLPNGPVKAVTLITDGNISILPIDNADGDPISYTGQVAGFMPPFMVRRVLATGTTATVRTLEN